MVVKHSYAVVMVVAKQLLGHCFVLLGHCHVVARHLLGVAKLLKGHC